MFRNTSKVITTKAVICTPIVVLMTSSFVLLSGFCSSTAKTSLSNVYAAEIKTGTYIHNTLSVYFEKDSKGKENFESFMLSPKNPDTLMVDGIEYVLSDVERDSDYDKQDYKGIFKHEGNDDIVVTFSGVENPENDNKDQIDLIISSDSLNIDKDKIKVPVIRRDFKKISFTMSANQKYDFIIAPYTNTNFYFKPSKAGNYTLTLKGTNRAKYWIAYVTEKPFVSIVPEYEGNFKTTKELYLNTDKEYNFYFWYDFIYLDKYNHLLVNLDEFEENASLEIKYEDSAANDNISTGRNQDSVSNEKNRNNTYNNYDDDDDDDDGSSGSFGFAKGDSRTGGKGATKADYVKTGTHTVCYDVSQISSKATKATVPETVKLGGKTYKVTSVAPKAFAGNTKIKEVNIGKNVKKIGAGAFDGCKNLKNLNVKTKRLTKKGTKDSLKGSSIKTINALAGYVDKYQTFFTKTNAGRKTKVKTK